MKVLIINSYAGSLTIAASQRHDDVVASMEDSGFGIDAQKLNFPDLRYVDELPWPPDLHLQGVVAIAHPPCAAFSQQNNVKTARGVKTDAFACHRRVMTYALSRGCDALAIESVPGAMAAAADYKRYASRHGYHVYFVLQNAVTFGVPQWRPRMWTVFTRADNLWLVHRPLYRTVGDVIQRRGTKPEYEGEVSSVFKRLAAAGYPQAKAIKTFLQAEHTGRLLTVARKVLDLPAGVNHGPVRDALQLHGLFGSYMPYALNPEGHAPTVLRDSAWYYLGRPLFVEEYMAIMGFPTSYRWPASMAREFRCYLSKGVCPPVARWVLDQLEANTGGTLDRLAEGDLTRFTARLRPGEVADFKPKLKEVEEGIRQRRRTS